ncbi:MAG: topoisomerase [Anaerolineales bacterium]|nr:MAG: topoisomerase [Anaerolineales bacterium]
MAHKTDSRPGCLSAFFSLPKKKNTPQNTHLPYRLRDDFLSPAELSFYKVLILLFGSRYSILTKVNLADVFFVMRPNENYGFHNRVAHRHVDFLLCEPGSMRPIAGIELDDASHNQASRRERDLFNDEVFKAAHLPLLHVPAQHDYNTKDIESRVLQHVNNGVGNIPPVPVEINQGRSIPFCPKCGIPMVLRTAGKGEYTGQHFYGCSNFPKCRERLPFVNPG